MTKFLLEAFLQVSITIPFAIFFLNKRKKNNYLRILFFVLIYSCYQIILSLPKLAPTFNLIDSRWNWEGKLFGILFGIICYFIFRKYFSENNFFTLRQNQENFNKSLVVTVASILIVTTIAYFTGSSEFNIETLAFQLTMPGIDEEVIFRGVLLGLLMSGLRNKTLFLGNSSLLLTAMLFGFMHALTLENDYSINFEPLYFIHTGIGGYIFGWITVKSRSLLLAILSHGLANFFAALATMSK